MTTSMEKSQVKYEIESIGPVDTSSPEQSQGELSPNQVKTIEMHATRVDITSGHKTIHLFPDEEGEYHCLSKGANSIIDHDKVIDYYDDEIQSTISMEKGKIGRRHATDIVDDLRIAYEYESFIDESTWKHGYKSIDVDDFPLYLGHDSIPSQEDVDDCYLGSELVQDDDMLCDSLQDVEGLLCNSSCFSDCGKSCTCSSLMCPHVPTFYDFEEEIIFTSGNDEVDLDRDFDSTDVMMEFDLCIPFGTELFPHHGDSYSSSSSKYSCTFIKET